MSLRTAKPGDAVVYRKAKFGNRPGPRAKSIHPAPAGDDYSYFVDKYWVVADIAPDGKLLLRTRTGKSHFVDPNDPMLRRAAWWERSLLRSQMPTLAQAEAAATTRNQRAERQSQNADLAGARGA